MEKTKENKIFKKGFLKRKQRGITLVALIVTIIVLLILAGVSLNLVAGSDGIINKASNAVSETKKATIKEEVELLIAELQMDYYSDYANNKANYSTALDYAKAELQEGDKKTGSGVTIKYTDPKYFYDDIEFEIDTNGNVKVGEQTGNSGGTTTPTTSPTVTETPSPTATTTPEPKYTVIYNANGGESTPESETDLAYGANVSLPSLTRTGFVFLGWAEEQNAETAPYTNTYTVSKDVTLYAVWKQRTGSLTSIAEVSDYGNKVNYTVTVNGITLGDGLNEDGSKNERDVWEIFYNDKAQNQVIIKYGDYLPNSTNLATGAGLVQGTGDYSTYGVKSSTSREDLVDKLNDITNWTNLLTPTLANKNATAKGAVDIETWIASWNETAGKTELYTKHYSDTTSTNAIGYCVGTEENITSYHTRVNNSNPLYFPDATGSVLNCAGYRIASLSGGHVASVMHISNNGDISHYSYDQENLGISPIIQLPASIIGTQQSDGSWNIE